MKKKSNQNKRNYWYDFIVRTLSIIVGGIILSYFIVPLLTPQPKFKIECTSHTISNYVNIMNSGNLVAKNVGLYIKTNHECSFLMSLLNSFLFDDLNFSWHRAPSNDPRLPSLTYYDTYIQQENWPTNLELTMQCNRKPLYVEIIIGGDNFKQVKEVCEFK